jgi:hypothetical protein
MGQGMQIRDIHANPWREALIEMLKKGNIYSINDWAAKKQRHYPRTLAEVSSNALITQKPKR